MTESDYEDFEEELYADSTVALTLYNTLCVNARALTADELYETALRTQHVHLEREQCDRALEKLVELGRVRSNGDGNYEVVAREKLIVAHRDLSDYDPATMEGGWEGWQVKDPRIRDGRGTRPLEALLGQPLTGRRPRPLPAGAGARGRRVDEKRLKRKAEKAERRAQRKELEVELPKYVKAKMRRASVPEYEAPEKRHVNRAEELRVDPNEAAAEVVVEIEEEVQS